MVNIPPLLCSTPPPIDFGEDEEEEECKVVNALALDEDGEEFTSSSVSNGVDDIIQAHDISLMKKGAVGIIDHAGFIASVTPPPLDDDNTDHNSNVKGKVDAVEAFNLYVSGLKEQSESSDEVIDDFPRIERSDESIIEAIKVNFPDHFNPDFQISNDDLKNTDEILYKQSEDCDEKSNITVDDAHAPSQLVLNNVSLEDVSDEECTSSSKHDIESAEIDENSEEYFTIQVINQPQTPKEIPASKVNFEEENVKQITDSIKCDNNTISTDIEESQTDFFSCNFEVDFEAFQKDEASHTSCQIVDNNLEQNLAKRPFENAKQEELKPSNDNEETPIVAKDIVIDDEKLNDDDFDEFDDFQDFAFHEAEITDVKQKVESLDNHIPWQTSNEAEQSSKEPLGDSPEDDFGDFEEATFTHEKTLAVNENVYQTSQPKDVQIQRASNDVNIISSIDISNMGMSIEPVLKMMFPTTMDENSPYEAANLPTQSSENKQTALIPPLPPVLSASYDPCSGPSSQVLLGSIDCACALKYQWKESNCRCALIKSLGIDSRSVLFGEKWSKPIFAADLSSLPLKPINYKTNDPSISSSSTAIVTTTTTTTTTTYYNNKNSNPDGKPRKEDDLVVSQKGKILDSIDLENSSLTNFDEIKRSLPSDLAAIENVKSLSESLQLQQMNFDSLQYNDCTMSSSLTKSDEPLSLNTTTITITSEINPKVENDFEQNFVKNPLEQMQPQFTVNSPHDIIDNEVPQSLNDFPVAVNIIDSCSSSQTFGNNFDESNINETFRDYDLSSVGTVMSSDMLSKGSDGLNSRSLSPNPNVGVFLDDYNEFKSNTSAINASPSLTLAAAGIPNVTIYDTSSHDIDEVVVTSTYAGPLKETHIYTPPKTQSKPTTLRMGSPVKSQTKPSPIDFDYEIASAGIIIDETVVKKEYRDIEYNPEFDILQSNGDVLNPRPAQEGIPPIIQENVTTESSKESNDWDDDFTDFQSAPVPVGSSGINRPMTTIHNTSQNDVSNDKIQKNPISVTSPSKTISSSLGTPSKGIILSPAILMPQAVNVSNNQNSQGKIHSIEWGTSATNINPDELARIEELFSSNTNNKVKDLTTSIHGSVSQNSSPKHAAFQNLSNVSNKNTSHVSHLSISATIASQERNQHNNSSTNNKSSNLASNDDDDWSDFVYVPVGQKNSRPSTTNPTVTSTLSTSNNSSLSFNINSILQASSSSSLSSFSNSNSTSTSISAPCFVNNFPTVVNSLSLASNENKFKASTNDFDDEWSDFVSSKPPPPPSLTTSSAFGLPPPTSTTLILSTPATTNLDTNTMNSLNAQSSPSASSSLTATSSTATSAASASASANPPTTTDTVQYNFAQYRSL